MTAAVSDSAHPDLVRGADGLLRPWWAAHDPLLREYYDTEWGLPVRDERGVFERLCLEGFQAGLSWRTVLHKRPALRAAFCHFDVEALLDFDDRDITRLLDNPEIIRHRGKISAVLHNAEATAALRAHGGLVELVWSHQPARTPMPRTAAEVPTTSPESRALASALRDAGFRFVGPTTMFALMEAIGVVDTNLLGSHRRGVSGLWDDEGNQKTVCG